MNCSQGAQLCGCLMFKSILSKKGYVVEPEPLPCSCFMIRVECASWCMSLINFHFKVVSVQLCPWFWLFSVWWRSLPVKADLLEPHKCASHQKPPVTMQACHLTDDHTYRQGPLLLPSLLTLAPTLQCRGYSILEFLCVNKNILWQLGAMLLILFP